MSFWPMFLCCPRCNTEHTLLDVAGSPEGKIQLGAECCGRRIGLDLTWEDVVAGATQREEGHLLKTDRKALDRQFRMEN